MSLEADERRTRDVIHGLIEEYLADKQLGPPYISVDKEDLTPSPQDSQHLGLERLTFRLFIQIPNPDKRLQKREVAQVNYYPETGSFRILTETDQSISMGDSFADGLWIYLQETDYGKVPRKVASGE
jgi:hypothetical protein